MKKSSVKRGDSPMRSEYDFSKGVRGKYAKRFQEGTNIVVLAPEVAEMFPDSAAVNDAFEGSRTNRKAKTNNENAPLTRNPPSYHSTPNHGGRIFCCMTGVRVLAK
jgi:hypothetical protein